MILRMFILMLPLYAGATDFIKQFDGQKTVDGQTIKASELRGKVILLDYWGMNCSPCVAALPKLQKLKETFSRNKSFILIASHVASADKSKVAAFMKAKKYTFPTLHYFHLKDKKGLIKCRSLPFLILIDREGKIVDSGPHINDLEKKVKTLLSLK